MPARQAYKEPPGSGVVMRHQHASHSRAPKTKQPVWKTTRIHVLGSKVAKREGATDQSKQASSYAVKQRAERRRHPDNAETSKVSPVDVSAHDVYWNSKKLPVV